MPKVNIASVRIRNGLSITSIADYLHLSPDQYLSYEWNNYLPGEIIPAFSKLFLVLPDQISVTPEEQYAQKRGQFLAQLRHYKNMTCDDFSFLLSHSTVQRWEAGKATPQYTILQNYAQFYNCNIDQILLCSYDNLAGIDPEAVVYFQKVNLCMDDKEMAKELGISLARWKSFISGTGKDDTSLIANALTERFHPDSNLLYIKLSEVQKRILTESPDPKSICFYRCLAKLSQRQVSERLNISQASIAKLETGTSIPCMSRLKSIAKLYNVPLEKFWLPVPGQS